ncbi:MAG: GIY-YIG nuclease family protein [Candidatus Pacebacteria bacterium]|nr:GIY-YIG nuclease family protein [Candidatus Paceibacterota bacterium]
MHGVYVLGLSDGELYVGYSSDVKSRVAEHQLGKVASTRRRLPVNLLYCELHGSRKDAMHRELYLKSGWGRKYLSRTIPETLATFRSKIRRV